MNRGGDFNAIFATPRCQIALPAFYSCNLKIAPQFDLKQHIKDLNRFVLPLFFVLSAIVMLVFIAIRSGSRGPKLPGEGLKPALIGLLEPGKEASFDSAFAVLSPIEMVQAPTAKTFDFPVGSERGAFTYNAQPFQIDRHLGDDLNGIGGKDSDHGDPVYAIAEGKVVFAGWPSDGWGNVVVLLHELESGKMVESVYGHLDSIRVPAGGQVRRGATLGTIGSAKERYPAHLHFELRGYPGLDLGIGYGDSGQGRLNGEATLVAWRGRRENQLAGVPSGEPLEPSPFNLDVEGTAVQAP